MDNSRDLPGYKYFVDPATGERPQVMVAFLDLVPDPGATVNGVLVPFAEELDRRERNYARREIQPGVHAYFGTEDAQQRFATGPTVIARDYLDLVEQGFQAIGQVDQFRRTTGPPPVPVVDLTRIDLPL